jgi:hypothetical protein
MGVKGIVGDDPVIIVSVLGKRCIVLDCTELPHIFLFVLHVLRSCLD